MDCEVEAGGEFGGRLRSPGDKSITQRAFLLGAIARGATRIDNICTSWDCRDTFRALRALAGEGGAFRYDEQGLRASIAESPDSGAFARLAGADEVLNVGNSGTGMRLLSGILVAAPFDSVIDGDVSLRRRPMRRIIEPLRRMGAEILAEDDDHAPLRIKGGRRLKGARHEMPVASAQLKSCLVLAGLCAEGESVIKQPAASRDHTERLLEHMGLKLSGDGLELHVPPLYAEGGCLRGAEIKVAGDISSAMFPLVGAAIAAGRLLVTDVGLNPGRCGGIDILRRMGADLRVENRRQWSGEPVGDIELRGGGALKGVDIEPEEVPGAIDEFPALFIAAACAEGTTRLRGASELRFKESDRLATMAAGLTTLGVRFELSDDGISIKGGARLKGGTIDSGGDHRVAMAFAMAGLRANEAIRIRRCDNIATSWPDFMSDMRKLGLKLESRS